MKILITGAAGFIGSNLVDKLLEKNFEITAIDNFNSYYPQEIKRDNIKHNLNNPLFKLCEGDILDVSFLDVVFKNKFDCVIHLAAQAGVRPSIENPVQYIKENIEGTVNILEKMKENNIPKIVFASSSSIYGNNTAEKFSEDLKTQEQISPYAVTKMSDELFLYTYHKLYNIKAVILRFFTVFGPRQRPDLAICKFINLIKNNKPLPLYGDGTAKRDYTYIDDIVEGIIKSIEYSASDFEIFNLGANSSISLKEMIQIIEKNLGKKAKINYLPSQKGDVIKTSSDISKAQKLLNYQVKTDFETGIKKYIEYLKNRPC